MTAILPNALICLSAVVAVLVIWSSLARYGRPALELREEMRSFTGERSVTFTVTEHRFALGARVLRPDFMARRKVLPDDPELRAAAA